MKKLSLTTLLIVITLGFSSCSVEENPTLIEDQGVSLFDKVTVQRNIDGSYYLDMKLNEGVGVDVESDEKLNKTELNFYSTDQVSKSSLNENLDLSNEGSLQLAINNTEKNTRSTITVFDDDIKFNRAESDDHLIDYSFTDNGDGTYDLGFRVDDNIQTDFVYNEDSNTYEIHLEPGNTTEVDYLRTFTKAEGEKLEIVFVNHYSRQLSRSESTAITTKPKVVVGND